MNTWNVQPLDSYRLGQYQLPLPCLLCGENNLIDATSCRNCTAPMEMTRIMNEAKKTRPQIIATLGAPGVGKSVYLGMLLDILTRQRERSDVTTLGTSSVDLQQTTVAALTRGEFPEPTPKNPEEWTWAHCQLSRSTRKTPLEVFLPDISGAAVVQEYEHRKSYPVIPGLVSKSTGLMLFVDSSRVQEGDKDEEFFALKLLQYFEEIQVQEAKRTKKRRKRAPNSHVAIVLAKADRSEECRHRTADFVRGQMAALWQHCKDQLPSHRFFAASAVGACATVKDRREFDVTIPLRVEPQGVIEPFRWLLGKIVG
jgi:hypothetical protein